MSDLISRKKVIDILEKEKSLRCSYEADIAIFSIEKGIKELPTAYDIDKVVEGLEKSSKWVNETNEYCDDDGNDYIPLSKAIEIVNQGGVSDDVCEAKQGKWIFDKFTAKYGNPYRCSCCSEEFGDTYNYCPNCGVSMKEVE